MSDEPVVVSDEFRVGEVRCRIELIAPLGARDSQVRLHQGIERAVRVEWHLLRQQGPLPAPRKKGCGCPGDD